MLGIQFRTKEELLRSQWAAKHMSVTEGTLYTTEDSPFPIHEYFKLGLLGKNIKMLEVNAGHALIEHMVADTLTDMNIEVGEEGADDAAEQKIWEWFTQIDFDSKLEENVRAMYGSGYGVGQIVRTVENDKNGYTLIAHDPATWYPTMPTLMWEKVVEGRIISVFSEEIGNHKRWFAFIEKHTEGNVEYQLLELDKATALEGKDVGLGTLERFAGLKDTETGLDTLAVFQIDWQKSSKHVVGGSVLGPIWSILQEISEFQTQIRQERIKHFRSKLAVPIQSLQRVEPDNDTMPDTSKSRRNAQQSSATYDMNQDVYPVPAGATMLPAYIQWDIAMIKAASDEIDKLLSRCAAMIGAPKSVFNIEEPGGNVKVETEKRKERRYVRKILLGQKRAGELVRQVILAWSKWNGEKIDEKNLKVTFANPFDLTREETVDLMRKMNSDSDFVSQKEAVKRIWPDMEPDERDALIDEIEEERQLKEPPPGSVLGNIPAVEL